MRCLRPQRGGIGSVAGEGENEYLTAEEYVELARPYFHLSCANAWAEVEEDQDAYLAIIDKMSAIRWIGCH